MAKSKTATVVTESSYDEDEVKAKADSTPEVPPPAQQEAFSAPPAPPSPPPPPPVDIPSRAQARAGMKTYRVWPYGELQRNGVVIKAGETIVLSPDEAAKIPCLIPEG